ncbi:hypothetical protein KY338_03860 [Candidatus Woesearchaeota archaeon]|nr:hypothetical protein [Candidatus Woesearchaeota archaeon]MBW3005448.1 hypothetical protein [Candidatus Woesearchaeota archaeon]
MMNANKIGLTLGSLLALVHLVWAILVRLGFGDNILGGLMRLHFISSPVAIAPFKIGTAIFLIIVTFVAGYVLGWLFAHFYNYYDKKCK